MIGNTELDKYSGVILTLYLNDMTYMQMCVCVYHCVGVYCVMHGPVEKSDCFIPASEGYGGLGLCLWAAVWMT